MQLRKYLWALRALAYRVSFDHIGSMSYMGKPVFLSGTKNIFIGNRVRIYPGCRMETMDGGRIEIQEDVSIGQNFHCISGGGTLKIGSRTTISSNVLVTNTDHSYEIIGQSVMAQPLRQRDTEIGENCFIGFGAIIQAGTKLGTQCIVGANAVVRGEFPDYCLIAGVPARIVKRYNAETGQWEKA